MYTVILSRQAQNDKVLLKRAGLEAKARSILNVLMENPFKIPPGYEKLKGDLNGLYSRRINRQHRIIYSVDQNARVVHVARMWTHYE